ncbi:MAG TPA: DUF4365 domain-containing protein [Pyrinomonadaceae bacterium]|nr:DUF4365 domain-containing protein [Pyrinomonadaceae bacterium]
MEENSVRFFKNLLPCDWNPNSIDHDYGQDLNLEIAEEGQYKGLDLVVQLKASAQSNAIDHAERQVFKVSTYNYLWANLRVVMIVKYVESEDEAYWILMKDVPAPSQANDSFTIHIPRRNRLSRIDWNEIAEYVRQVSEGKLNAWRQRNS